MLSRTLKNGDPVESLGLGFLRCNYRKITGTTVSIGHFPDRKDASDLFLLHHAYLSLFRIDSVLTILSGCYLKNEEERSVYWTISVD